MPASGRVGSVLLILGAVLLIAALFLPWYAFGSSSSAGSDTQLFYLGLATENGTVRYSCSGLPCHPDTSYDAQQYGSIGAVAEAGLLATGAGVAAGVSAGLLTLNPRGPAGRRRLANALGIAAALLAVSGPLAFATALPGAEGRAVPAPGRPTASGPWSSFVGSTGFSEPHVGTVSLGWDPGVGWYLGVAAFALLVAGVLLWRRGRGVPAQVTPGASGSTQG